MNMSLSDHVFRREYESLRDDVVTDFYIPALSESVLYRRAVGYFTSRALELVFQGIESLMLRGGKIQIITSPKLDPADVKEIRDGYALRSLIERKLDVAMSEILANDGPEQLGLLGALIAKGQLEIKIAFTTKGDYLFHSKYGIFEDELGNKLAFNGSNNETERALRKNLESFEVYCGWIQEDADRVRIHEQKFEDLWSNALSYCEVIDFPDVNAKRLVALGEELREQAEGLNSTVSENLKNWLRTAYLDFKIPTDLEIRDYQQEAVEEWWKASHKGIFAMATGTGKTKTALIAAAKIYEKFASASPPQRLFIAIVVPYESLVEQWAKDVLSFGVSAIQVRGNSHTWSEALRAQIHAVNIGVRRICIAIATNQSFSRPKFQAFLETVRVPILLVADEVHNLGAATYLKALPEKAHLRLGLSATPERMGDEEGNEGIQKYFGGEVYEYPMEKAIHNGFLTTYRYYPRVVELSDLEAEKYVRLTEKIDKIYAIERGRNSENQDFSENIALKKLLLERSRLIAHASAKLSAFKKDIKQNAEEFNQLIYCAEGTDPLGQLPVKQTAYVLDFLASELGIRAAEYSSNTPLRERSELLRSFTESNWIQALVSMRCLDEGVDIPSAKIGYILASTTNYRQSVQRRGRLLRLAEGKNEAIIYDYLVIPSEMYHDGKIGRRLLRNEIKRAEEFRRLATNSHYAASIINPLKTKYRLLDL